MIQTIILFVAVLTAVTCIYNTIRKYRELNQGKVFMHSFTINVLIMSICLTYILWYCN